MLAAFILCFVIHSIWFYAVYLIAQNLGIPTSFMSLSMITAISWLVTAVPISFGGLGVRELSYVVMLCSQGVDETAAAALSLAQFGIGLIVAVFSIPFIMMSKRGTKTVTA